MATTNHFELVQKLYIAYYQRPADPAGLKYWSDQIKAHADNASTIVSAFATSLESVALYGAIDATNIGAVIDKIYLALFNRSPDAAGKQFYVSGFQAGTFTPGTITLDVLNGAKNGDNTAIQNKVQVANLFTARVDGRPLSDAAFGKGSSFDATYSGDTDAKAARDILKTVTSNPATVLTPAQVTEKIQNTIADPGDPLFPSPPPPPPPAPTFTVTENAGTHAVSFGGTATGDITIAWAGTVGSTVATFTRAGLTGTANFLTAASIALGATDVLSTSAANIAGMTISGATGTVKLTDTSLAASVLTTLDTAIAGTLNAATVTTITGSVADIKAVAAAAGITKATSWSATPTDTSVSVADANILDAANGTGVLTAVITQNDVTTLKTLTGTNNAYTLTVTDATAAAADLLALDALTTVVVGAGAVTTITGSAADIKAVAAAAGITKATNWSATPTDTSVSVADANILDAANGTGVLTATITQGDVTTLKTLTGTNNAYTLTVTDTTAAAADLLALDARTTVAVGAGAVTTITGLAADIKAVAAAAGITKATNWSATLSDTSVSVADANILDAANGTGVLTATITQGDVTTLKTLTSTNNAYTLTVTDTTAAAADLLALDALTTVVVDAGAVTTITGSVADIKAVAAAAGITKATSWSATPTDTSVSVADANILDAANGTGVLTAVITQNDVTTLKTLTGTNNAYSLTVTDATAAAADLLALDALTTVAVGASAVTTITGSASDIAALVAAKTAGTITLAADFAATLNDAHNLAQLKAINNATSGTITLHDLSIALTGWAIDVTAALNGITPYTGTVTLSDSGTVAVTVLSGIESLTSGLVTAANVTTVAGGATAIAALAAKVGSSGDKISLGTMAGEISDVAVAITGAASINQWDAIDSQTSGAISGAISDTIALANGKDFTTGYTGNTGVTLTGSDGDQTVTGSAFADTLIGGKGSDILTGGAGADIFKYTSLLDFGDRIMDFGTGADLLHVSGVAAFGGFFVQSGVTSGSSYTTHNVFIFSGASGAEVDINTVATQIANHASVNATAGLIILKEDTSHEVEVWYCADMNNNGAKQLIATLVGVDITTITASNLA